jgi:hypothetical protein
LLQFTDTICANTTFNNPLDANADNIYQVNIRASDGQAFSNLALSINVTANAVFMPADNFANRCGIPRIGTDPNTNAPYPDIQGTFADENNFLRSWSNDQYLWYNEIADVDPKQMPVLPKMLRTTSS